MQSFTRLHHILVAVVTYLWFYTLEVQASQVTVVHNNNSITFNNSLTPDGKQLMFTEVDSERNRITIKIGELVNGKIVSVSPLLIDGHEVDGSDVHISPNGEMLLFSARKPFLSNAEMDDYDLYVSYKSAAGWSTPTALPSTVNSDSDEFYPSIASNGNLYFSRRIKGQNLDIFVSQYVDGQYMQAERLGTQVNTVLLEGDSFVTSDESALVFARMNAEDSEGMTDLYISYRSEKGWSTARNMGKKVNSKGIDGSPFVSRDGQWLYFTSSRDGKDVTKFDKSLGLYRIPFQTESDYLQR